MSFYLKDILLFLHDPSQHENTSEKVLKVFFKASLIAKLMKYLFSVAVSHFSA